MNVSIVAPSILRREDVALQEAAIKVLTNDHCNLNLGCHATDIINRQSGAFLVMNDNSSIPVDRVIFCTGRSPEISLGSLNLDKAGIAWSSDGVEVDSYLRSKTVRHIYASGDCASSVSPNNRCSIHAGWTGFGAVRNAMLPWFLRSPAVHQYVPRVVYTDPELASAGMTRAECARKFGANGYDRLLVPEAGSDRADVESKERFTSANFLEIRAEKINGRILGASACGPAAAEAINEVCLALTKRLTIRDIARTLHSYPSHGYLLYRSSMTLATQNISGLLAGCGTCGRFLAAFIRLCERVKTIFNFKWLPWKRQAAIKLFGWQAKGSSSALVMQNGNGSCGLVSFLDAYPNETLCAQVLDNDCRLGLHLGHSDFVEWLDQKPKG